jgi:hypothetical protein
MNGQQVQAAIGICYEIAYGNSMRKRAQQAGVLMTLTERHLVRSVYWSSSAYANRPGYELWRMAVGCCARANDGITGRG